MNSCKRIFLSSVAKGLQEYRLAVINAVQGMDDTRVTRMEDFGARDCDPDELCQRLASECDLFVGILSHEYGNSPPGSQKSFTEREYEAAVKAKRPRLMFLAPDDFCVPNNIVESEDLRTRQTEFRKRVLTERQVAFFQTPEDLALKVTQAVHNNWQETTSMPPMTLLRFGFVSNQMGFDTGLVITNASARPFAARPQAGSFELHLYGRLGQDMWSIDDTGVVPTAVKCPIIWPGGQWTSILSLVQPNFQGYIVAECWFPDACGFAVVGDIGFRYVMSGYLADVLDPSTRLRRLEPAWPSARIRNVAELTPGDTKS